MMPDASVPRWGYAALAGAGLAAALLVLRGGGDLFGLALPPALLLALAGLGAALGALALRVRRRAVPLALAAGALLVLAVLPGGAPDPGPAGYALGVLFGALLLAFGEAVHARVRHARAREALGDDPGAHDHLGRVAREGLRALGVRTLLAALVAFAGVLLALLLALAGPAPLRAGLETPAPLGVAVASLSLMGGGALFVLARGSRLRRAAAPAQETEPDAHD